MNAANPEIHRRTTAREILEQLDGRVDAFVAGVGTGGSLTGVGEVLKETLSSVRVIAVEPAGSPVLSGGGAGFSYIEGIGAGFVPPVLNLEVIDEVRVIDDDDAYEMARRLAREEGLLVGISAGANAYIAAQVAREMGLTARVATILCDSGLRYLSSRAFE